MKRSKAEVAAEITALKALRPTGPFSRKTAASIEVQIEALEHGIDETAEEWNDLSESEQGAAMDAAGWADGSMREKPSEGFGDLCA